MIIFYFISLYIIRGCETVKILCYILHFYCRINKNSTAIIDTKVYPLSVCSWKFNAIKVFGLYTRLFLIIGYVGCQSRGSRRGDQRAMTNRRGITGCLHIEARLIQQGGSYDYMLDTPH